jgi:hypothetical protein
MFEEKSRRIPPESLQVQPLPDRKRGDLAGQAGTEIFRRVLSGAVHQDKAFKFKRGKIGRTRRSSRRRSGRKRRIFCRSTARVRKQAVRESFSGFPPADIESV